MQISQIAARFTAAILAVGAGLAVVAQGPITDKVIVTFDNPVMVSGKRLAPGSYTIRQLPTASNPRILEFSSEDGTRLETTVSAIPTYDPLNTKETSVILRQRNGEYHVSKVWVEGKNFGYQLPVDADTSTQEASTTNRDEMRLTASYAAAAQNQPYVNQAQATTTDSAASATTQAETTTAQATPEPQQPTPAPVPTDQNQPNQNGTTPAQDAQTTGTPGGATATQEATAQDTSAQDTMGIPATNSDWMAFVALGVVFAAAGVVLFRMDR